MSDEIDNLIATKIMGWVVDDGRTCLQRRESRRLSKRAYSGHDRATGATGFCFATSASKARMIVFRSGRDAGFDTKVQDIVIGRMPALDGRCPSDYRNQFFTLEHMQHLPLPNTSDQRAGGSQP